MLDYHYYTFLVVCETLNFTKAAELLNLTQPAVSQHIAYLQETLGLLLFKYEKKKITLTPAGHRLYKTASKLKYDSERHLEMIKNLDEKMTLYLGCTFTVGYFMIASNLRTFITNHPTIEINLYVENTAHLLNELELGKIDCAFIEGPFDHNRFIAKPFQAASIIGVCSPDATVANRQVAWEDLYEYNLIIREKGSGTRSAFETILDHENISLHSFASTMSIGSYAVIKEFVAKNLGISFVYEPSVKKELQNGELVKLDFGYPFEERLFNFIYLEETSGTKSILDDFSTFDCSTF